MNLTINIISMLGIIVLAIWVNGNIVFSGKEKLNQLVVLLLIFIVIMAEACCTISEENGVAYIRSNIFFNVIGYILTPFIPIINIRQFIDKKVKGWMSLLIIPIVNAVFVLLSPAKGYIFSVSEKNVHSRGSLYIVFIGAFMASLLADIIIKFIKIRKLPSYFKLVIGSGSAFLTIGILIEVIVPEYHFTWLVITMYMFMQYAYLCEMHSLVDGLTLVFNKASFNKQMNALNAEFCNGTVVCMADVNNFKSINDNYGHMYGDVCLKKVAELLVKAFSGNCHVFRYGGDEFAIICYKTSEENIKKNIMYFYQEVKNEQKLDERFPNAAIGYSFLRAWQKSSDIIEEIDAKMYENKKAMKK